jgi:hypothetical protein
MTGPVMGRSGLERAALERFGDSQTDRQIVESFTPGRLRACLTFGVSPRDFFLTSLERGTFRVLA